MAVGDEEYLPIEWGNILRQEKRYKKYVGRVIYEIKAFWTIDYGRVHDPTYHWEPILATHSEGRCPNCCKEFVSEEFLKKPIAIDKRCICGRHWIFVLPENRDRCIYCTEVKIFEIVRKIEGGLEIKEEVKEKKEQRQQKQQKGEIVYHFISADDWGEMLGVPIREEKGEIPECCKEQLRKFSMENFVNLPCRDGCHLITQWVWGPSCIDGAYNREIIIRKN